MHLSFLRPLYDRPGPWASVYLDVNRASEDAQHAIELRWRAAEKALTTAGADRETVGAIGDELDGHRTARGLAVFAAGGRVHLAEELPDPPGDSHAGWGPLPHVMPLVARRGERVPYVRVVVDHTGADLVNMTAGGAARSATVTGPAQFPMHKVSAGGWSEGRYQRTTQNTWERNAAEVAAAVLEAAEHSAAEVIVVAGDPQSRPMLITHLPEHWRPRIVETDTGSRSDPGSLDDVTLQAVARRAAERTAEVVDRFRMQLGRDGAAANGLPAVVTALQRGQVDTLLLVDDPGSTDELWVGAGPLELSFDPADLRAQGVSDPVKVRADAAIVRALTAVDADLVLVGPDDVDLEHGVGAVLRYADAATRQR